MSIDFHVAPQAARRLLDGILHREAEFHLDETLLPVGAVQLRHLRLRGFGVLLVEHERNDDLLFRRLLVGGLAVLPADGGVDVLGRLMSGGNGADDRIRTRHGIAARIELADSSSGRRFPWPDRR